MTMQCPLCLSHQVISLNHGKKISGIIGSVTDAVREIAEATTGEAATDGIAGDQRDEAGDQRVQGNYRCQVCGFNYSLRIA
jgi:hypothetical protein